MKKPIPKKTKLQKARVLVSKLMELDSTDEGLKLRAMQILDRMEMPMSEILSKVPGDSVSAKCVKIGVSRQTWYAWLRGVSRPNTKLSKKIATVTGIKWEDVQGKTRLSPPRPSAPF
jgi:transcriptional regulator with XRE-family HTH domain